MASNKLSRNEFDIMVVLAEKGIKLSQRELEVESGHSLSTVNRTLKDLSEKGYVEDGLPSSKGLKTLDEYAVKSAVYIAAGFGSRLVPITLNTPKPLVRVNGKRLIDTSIDAMLELGVTDITIVRGYLSEQFDQLKYKYPMIKFIENPLFNEANNISSVVVARYMLENAYVLESDLLVNNPKVLKKYHYCSDYICSYVDRTDDWCFNVKDNIICDEKIGGENCYQLKGISYWDSADGKKLADHIEKAYNSPGGKELYWEQVPFVKYKNEYKVEISECKMNDIIEIDTFNELKKIDKTYDI